MSTGHVIITGATGFIGAACVREFLAHGWRVSALGHARPAGRLADLHGHPALDAATCSITDRAALGRALDERVAAAGGGACRALVHCAGRASDVGRDRSFSRVNLEGVRNICQAVRELGIGRLVHVSTTDVYGIRDFRDADETTPHENNRRNPYPKYKILAERHIRATLPPERYAILRPAFVWGPGDETILPRVVAFLRASPVILHFGRWRGANRWPLAYVGNVARVARAAATSDLALGEAFNVVDPEPITLDAYYRMIIALCLPGQPAKHSLTVPFRLAWPAAALSTLLSDLLDRTHPLADPSLYSLRHVAHSQDFSGAKAAGLLAACGSGFIDRAAALAELRAALQASAARSTIGAASA